AALRQADPSSQRHRPRSADPETVEAFRLLPADVDRLDAGAARPAAAPLDHRLDALARALEDRRDGAIWLVARPAGDAERGRARTHLRTEEHALHEPGDADGGPSAHRRR